MSDAVILVTHDKFDVGKGQGRTDKRVAFPHGDLHLMLTRSHS